MFLKRLESSGLPTTHFPFLNPPRDQQRQIRYISNPLGSEVNQGSLQPKPALSSADHSLRGSTRIHLENKARAQPNMKKEGSISWEKLEDAAECIFLSEREFMERRDRTEDA